MKRQVAFEKKGGRKCCLDSTPELLEAFSVVVDMRTAGDPMQDGVRWTNLTRGEISEGLADAGYQVSVTVVDRLLEEADMGQRQPQKIKTMVHDADRDEQFRHIADLKEEYQAAGLPVLSMDTKKREMLGDYVRPGRVLSDARLRGWDHDYPTHSAGVVIPHGLFDVALNQGYLHLGDSHDTSQFACRTGQDLKCRARQALHRPHGKKYRYATRSPTWTGRPAASVVTPSPSLAMVPTCSWPVFSGSGRPIRT